MRREQKHLGLFNIENDSAVFISASTKKIKASGTQSAFPMPFMVVGGSHYIAGVVPDKDIGRTMTFLMQMRGIYRTLWRSSTAIFSMCSVWGNISTGWRRVTR